MAITWRSWLPSIFLAATMRPSNSDFISWFRQDKGIAGVLKLWKRFRVWQPRNIVWVYGMNSLPFVYFHWYGNLSTLIITIHPFMQSPLDGAPWNFSHSQVRQLCSAWLSVANLKQAAGEYKGNTLTIFCWKRSDGCTFCVHTDKSKNRYLPEKVGQRKLFGECSHMWCLHSSILQ